MVQIWSRNTLKFRGNETFQPHRARRQHLKRHCGLPPESCIIQGQNLALTVLFLPSSLNCGDDMKMKLWRNDEMILVKGLEFAILGFQGESQGRFGDLKLLLGLCVWCGGFDVGCGGLGFGAGSLEFQVSGFGFQVSGLWFWVLSFCFRISGFRFRAPGFGFRFSVFGIRFRFSVFRFRGFGYVRPLSSEFGTIKTVNARFWP